MDRLIRRARMAAVVFVALGSCAAAVVGVAMVLSPERLPSVATWGLIALLAMVVLPAVTALCWAVDRATVQRSRARLDHTPFAADEAGEEDATSETRVAPAVRQHPPGRLAERARRSGRATGASEHVES
ncbi:MAG: hypothetical protein AAGG07_07450 [Planctomycetota bacterium]